MVEQIEKEGLGADHKEDSFEQISDQPNQNKVAKRKKKRRFRKRHQSVVKELSNSPQSKFFNNHLVVV